MAHATTFDAGLARHIPGARWFAGLRKALADRALYWRTIGELESLSDRDLLDLGLRRDDLGRIARESVYGA